MDQLNTILQELKTVLATTTNFSTDKITFSNKELDLFPQIYIELEDLDTELVALGIAKHTIKCIVSIKTPFKNTDESFFVHLNLVKSVLNILNTNRSLNGTTDFLNIFGIRFGDQDEGKLRVSQMSLEIPYETEISE